MTTTTEGTKLSDELKREPKIPAGVVKVTANLPKEVVDALRQMAERRRVTMTEMLRRAISTEHWLETVRREGKKVLLEDRGEVREVIFKD